MCPERANEEVRSLGGQGLSIQLVELKGQYYAMVNGIESPSPPWNKACFDILIAIPATYDAAELDSFYVELPCVFNGGEHPRIKGAVIELLDRKWQLVSWHYKEGRPWKRYQDNLETHITHCHGFFLDRGAVNGR